MKKFLNYILILVVLVGVFAPIFNIDAQIIEEIGVCSYLQSGQQVRSQSSKSQCDAVSTLHVWQTQAEFASKPVDLFNMTSMGNTNTADNFNDVNNIGSCNVWNLTGTIGGCIAAALSKIAFVFMKIASLLVGITGVLLNWVITETIVKMSVNISGMTGINVAWKIIRDLMNIAFIFLLIYYGIKLILSQENTGNIQKFIFGIVLASLLINFSLFFTKVIIDSSNIVTIGIYDVISGDTSTGTYGNVSGLSDRMMKSLGLQSLLGTKPLDLGVNNDNNYSYLAANLLSMVLFLISAFVFLAVSVMLIVRYIVLIYLMALSPIAYMGMALPGMQKNAQEWWTTFMGQIIFAPLFMLMMLVTLTLIAENFVSANPTSLTNLGTASSTINIIFNFSLIIGFTIASLVISKKYSTQGSSYVKKLTDGATSFAGNALFGGAGFVGRQLGGRAGLGNSSVEELEARVAKGGIQGQRARARLALATGSYDLRSGKVGETITGNLGTDFGKGSLINSKAGIGGRSADLGNYKKERESDMDKAMKGYVDKRNWNGLAEYIETGKPSSMGQEEWEKRQQYIYKKLSNRDRLSAENALITRMGAAADPLINELRGKLPIDDQIKIYTDRKEWDKVAQFVLDKTDKGVTTPRNPDEQQYIYEKLNPRDRIELENELRKSTYSTRAITGTNVADKLRDKLSEEDKDKTAEAGKKSNKAKIQERKIDNIELLVGGRALPAGSTATIESEIKSLNPKQTSNLSSEALKHPDVIRNLSNQQLKDIIENGDYDDSVRSAILSIANDRTAIHPMAKAQHKYFELPASQIAWNI